MVRDRLFINPHFVIRDAGTLRRFAGLPTAHCGWTLEAVKPDRGDPPVPEGAGFDGVYTANAGFRFASSSLCTKSCGRFLRFARADFTEFDEFSVEIVPAFL